MPKFRAASRVLVTALPLALAACGDATESEPAASVPNEARFEAGPFTVEPSSELVMCSYVRGTNEVEADVTSFLTEQSHGGHHLIVYTVDHAVDLPPTPCSQGGQPGWAQVMVSQIVQEEQAFPAGVGFHVQAHQQYVMETHYINPSSEPMEVESAFTARFAGEGQVTQRAATYFFGTMNIDIAPGSAFSKEVTCKPPEAMRLQTMFGHQHRRGTGIAVDMHAGSTPERVYETELWEGPPIARFDDGLDLTPDGGIRVACEWQNESTDVLRFPHEMCFAVGYYWPAESGIFCASGGGTDECLCRYQGRDDTGEGGSKVEVRVTREEEIEGAKGDLDKGAPIYCALFRTEDWATIVPKDGAQPWYLRDAVDVVLATDSDVATFDVEDVTPGDYVVTCMMDTIGGGFFPGTGDVVNLGPPEITAIAGETTHVDVRLDFAIP